MRFASILALLIVTATAPVACKPRGAASTHVALRADASQLRADFNAGVGSVRLVVLVSPT